jgi:eukaryotic-like serine/threonine-protein kinase
VEPERRDRAEKLYLTAATLSGDALAAFLEESCGTDDRLRQEVESLLGRYHVTHQAGKKTAPSGAAKVHAGTADSPRTTDDAMGLIGQTLSHYRIVARLGGGGMGVVYKAEDTRLGRMVALKFLPDAAPSDSNAIERFKREARAASALNHPHICTIHDIGERNGRQFIVMELLEGKTLKYHIAGRSLAVGEIARLGVQIAEALEAAHAKGIVHRDIKPANLFVTARERVKVLDFGLAKLLQPGSAETSAEEMVQTRGPVGTLPYMAPEQVLGRNVDERADIYGLGMVLYEMAAGKRPFREDLVSHLTDDILHQAPVPPCRLRHGLPKRFETIILECLGKDPAKRCRSAQELRTSLEEFVTPSAAGSRLPLVWAAVIVGGLIVVAGTVAAFRAGGWRNRFWLDASRPRIESLAVLPLTNLTGDAQQDFFVDGMTDELTTNLAQIGSLRILSRTSAMQMKDNKSPLPQLARQLGVDAIVEGSVTRSGDRVRITAQLIEADIDRHLWAKSYERASRDILDLQDELARDIANEIKVTLTPIDKKRLAGAHALDPQAYDDYLRGRYFWNRRTEAELHKAKDYFERAIAKDPAYAPAYSGLADTYFYLGYVWGHIPPREAIPLSQAAAKKAIELDDAGAEGHASLGMTHMAYDWDFRAAEEELKRATALNPNYAHAHHVYSILLALLGRQEESVAEIRKAADVDPLSIPVRNMLAGRLAANGHCDEAIAEDKKTIELNPNATHLGLLHQRWSYCYAVQGEDKKAFEEELQMKLADGAAPQEIEELRRVYAASGRKGIWRRQLQELLAMWDKDHWHDTPGNIAVMYANLGEMDKAFEWIDKGIEVRSTSLFWILINDSPLKPDPRFEEMKKKMGARY